MNSQFVFSNSYKPFNQFHNKYWRDPGIAFHIFNHDHIVGFVGLTSMSSDCVIVDPVFIKPQYRGSLVFYKCMKKLHDTVIRLGFHKFVFMVMPDDVIAKNFAEKLNGHWFAETEEGFYVICDLPIWRNHGKS